MVTPIGLGCAPLGDMPEAFGHSAPEELALATVRAVLDSPINHIDTAALYGDGESERRIGAVLKEIGGLPSGMVLQTKAGRDPKTGDFSGETIKRRFERSLALLGVDRVDAVYLHDPEHTSFEEAMAPNGPVEVLKRFQEQGAFDHLGVAGGPVDVELRYIETGAFEAVITHNRYTLLNRTAEPILVVAARRGMGILNAAPYGSGVLAKGSAYPRYAYQPITGDLMNSLRSIEAICERYGVPLAAVALQFSLRDPRIHSTVVGMTRPERVEQTIELARAPIPDQLWSEVEAVSVSDEDPEIGRWAS
jgi:D-threo-aldose 1-dehydrogenase